MIVIIITVVTKRFVIAVLIITDHDTSLQVLNVGETAKNIGSSDLVHAFHL